MHRPIPSFLSRALFLGGLLLAGAARAKSPAAVNPYPGYRSAIYSDPANWLDGKDVGGDFANIPLCHTPHDTGCVITYGSFRSIAPPPANSLFGRSLQPGWKAACTNPASLRGGTGTLHPFLPTNPRPPRSRRRSSHCRDSSTPHARRRTGSSISRSR